MDDQNSIKDQVKKQDEENYGDDISGEVMDIDEKIGETFGEDAKERVEVNEPFSGGDEVNKDEKTRRGLK